MKKPYMKIFFAILAGGLGLATAGRGDNMTTLAGQTYSNFVVQHYDQQGYTVYHDGGVTHVPYSEIRPELRGHYKALSMIPISRAKLERTEAGVAGPADLVTLSGQVYRNVEVKKVEDAHLVIAHDTGMDTVHFSALSAAMREKARRMPVVPDPAPGPQDIVTTYGQVFRNTEIVREEPDGLTFRHAGGQTKLGFPALGVEMQQKYGYDPVQAWQYGRETAAASRATGAPEAEKPTGPPTFEVYAIETEKLPDFKFWVRFAIRNITDVHQDVKAYPTQEKMVAVADPKTIELEPHSSKELQQFVVLSIAPTYLVLSTENYRTNCLLVWK
jgi:hypothetical protein